MLALLRGVVMSTTGLAVFDETVQLSNVWLNELMGELGWDNKQRTYRVPNKH